MSEALEFLAQEEAAAEQAETVNESAQIEEVEIITEASDSAGDLAVFITGTVSSLVRMFEPRIDMTAEVDEAREEVGPVVEKYELHKGGAGGAFAYQPEVQAGFWLGRFIKSVVRQFKHFAAIDKKQSAQPEKQPEAEPVKNEIRPDQREPEATELAHALPSQVGLWQEPDANTSGPDS